MPVRLVQHRLLVLLRIHFNYAEQLCLNIAEIMRNTYNYVLYYYYYYVKVVFFYAITVLKDKLCSVENKMEELKRENAGGLYVIKKNNNNNICSTSVSLLIQPFAADLKATIGASENKISGRLARTALGLGLDCVPLSFTLYFHVVHLGLLTKYQFQRKTKR